MPLTEETREAIRTAPGPIRQIARDWNVSPGTVGDIKRGRVRGTKEPEVMNDNEIAHCYVTPVGLNLPDSVSLNDALAIGAQLSIRYRQMYWLIGDWLNWMEAHHADVLPQALADFGFDQEDYAKTVGNWMRVCRNIPPERRHLQLSFTHHAEVYALPAPEADAILEEAEKNDLNSLAIRQMVKERRVNGKAAKSPEAVTPSPEASVADGDSAPATAMSEASFDLQWEKVQEVCADLFGASNDKELVVAARTLITELQELVRLGECA